MKILIDGDGCPVVNIAMEVAKDFNIQVILVCDTSHIFNKQGIEIVVLDKGMDVVDFAIVNRINKGDIVITQDYGLASMVLTKKGYAINQNGWIYSNENIEQLLLTRHISKKIRNSGKRVKGCKKRSKEDNVKFREGLESLCKQVLNK